MNVILLLIVLCHVADLFFTLHYLTPGIELNPLAAALWQEFGPLALVFLKLPTVAFFVIMTKIFQQKHPKKAMFIAILVLIASALPVGMFIHLWSII